MNVRWLVVVTPDGTAVDLRHSACRTAYHLCDLVRVGVARIRLRVARTVTGRVG